MKTSVAHFLRLRSDERGAALVLVMVLGVVMTLVIGTAVAISLSGMRTSKTSENWNAALAAAYAGIEEYQNRLANDSTYSKYGNAASAFTSGSGSQVSLDPGNPAFGVAAGGSWATVPGSGGAASFRYEVDNSRYTSSGILTIRSTGRVGTETRTVVADLKQKGFIDFLYFTDYEVQDPTQGGASCTVSYTWVAGNTCTKIQFAPLDVVNGPVHSNDTLQLCGTFNGEVTTGSNLSPNYETVCTPTFKFGKPKTSQLIGMPPTNAEMKREVRSDLTNDGVPRPGCLYTGPTIITLLSNGKMNVKSPFTRATNVVGDPPSGGSAPAACGTPSALGSEDGATIAVPNQNLVYVQNVPQITTDPNYTAGTKNPAGFTCNSVDKGGWKFATGAKQVRYPLTTEDFVPETSPVHYGCRNGDVYVSGVLKGALTIAAENYGYVTGDVTYSDAGADILGLVGNNAVWVWNPIDCTKTVTTGGKVSCTEANFLTTDNRTISAAILSVSHTFVAQNHNVKNMATGGKRGTLTVVGAIAQKFRGPVGTSGSPGTGFLKNYIYDDRLRVTAPPKFLTPTSTTYGVSQTGSTGAAFNADGTAK